MASHGPQVFISYHRADLAIAEQVRAHLLTNQIKTWMDHYDIPAGAYWPDEIDRGLNQSALVVGVLSPDSAASRNVKNEWDWAIQNGKQLILLMTRQCVIPHRYISINFIDATRDDLSDALDQLLQVPELRVSRTPETPPRGTPAAATSTSPTRCMARAGRPGLVPGYISHVEHTGSSGLANSLLRRLCLVRTGHALRQARHGCLTGPGVSPPSKSGWTTSGRSWMPVE